MTKALWRHPKIESDLLNITSHIADKNPEAAFRFLEEVESTFEWIERYPFTGQPYEVPMRRLSGIRVLARKSHRS